MYVYLLVAVLTFWFIWRWTRRNNVISNYSSRHVLVTGCDSGFGNMLVKRLDELGFNVFAGCLTQTGSEKLENETSERVSVLNFDVTSTESIEKAFDVVKSKLDGQKGLWGLVNNAGISGPISPSEWILKTDYIQALDVNTLGMIETTRVFLPLVLKVKGRVINMTSVMGRIAACPAPYIVSKFAAEGYSDVLRRELYKRGVTVHILEPGFFQTNFTNLGRILRSTQDYYNKLPNHLQTYYGQSFIDKTREMYTLLINRFVSSKTHLVVDAYIHALTSRYPKHRYIVGNDAKYFFRILRNLPETVADYILTRDMDIPEAER